MRVRSDADVQLKSRYDVSQSCDMRSENLVSRQGIAVQMSAHSADVERMEANQRIEGQHRIGSHATGSNELTHATWWCCCYS